MSVSVPLGLRCWVGLLAGNLVGRASSALGRGAGATIPGAVAMRVSPDLLRRLSVGRQITLVSATNGKTTTTGMLTAALGVHGQAVLTNTEGSNLERGVLAALMTDPRARTAAVALEVDELALPEVADKTGATLCILGNLSRDQLDRMTESRLVVRRWQEMFAALAARIRAGERRPMAVVANADDPLVTAALTGEWSAGPAAPVQVIWVGVGQLWTADAASCPMCAQPWVFEPGSYACGACGFRRPEPEWRLSGQHVQGPDGRCLALPLQLPGRSNRANALLAIVAAQVRGIEPEPAVAAISALQSVAGRYAVVDHGSGPVRLLLAKNPAGWQEMLAQHTEEAELGQQAADRAHVKADPARPIVLALNAQIADGEDTSWIWDVPFEMLAGTPVVVSGERAEDLAVRLRYAQLPFELVRDPLEAVERARAHAGKPVDLLATYTAFSAVRRSLGLGS